MTLMYYSGADQDCLPEWEQRAELQAEVLIGDGGKRVVQKYDISDASCKWLESTERTLCDTL